MNSSRVNITPAVPSAHLRLKVTRMRPAGVSSSRPRARAGQLRETVSRVAARIESLQLAPHERREASVRRRDRLSQLRHRLPRHSVNQLCPTLPSSFYWCPVMTRRASFAHSRSGPTTPFCPPFATRAKTGAWPGPTCGHGAGAAGARTWRRVFDAPRTGCSTWLRKRSSR